MTVESLCLAGAMDPDLRGRPVKLHIPREGGAPHLLGTTTYVAKIKLGIDKEGRIQAIRNTFFFDTGVSAEYGANPVRSAGYTSTGCYYVPNVWTDSYAVYTNKPFGGPTGASVCRSSWGPWRSSSTSPPGRSAWIPLSSG